MFSRRPPARYGKCTEWRTHDVILGWIGPGRKGGPQAQAKGSPLFPLDSVFTEWQEAGSRTGKRVGGSNPYLGGNSLASGRTLNSGLKQRLPMSPRSAAPPGAPMITDIRGSILGDTPATGMRHSSTEACGCA